MLEKILQMIQTTGMNEKQFTIAADLHPNIFSKWKKGTSTPKLDVLIKIADYFQISLDELVGRKVKEKPIEKMIEKLTPKQQKTVEAYIQGILDSSK